MATILLDMARDRTTDLAKRPCEIDWQAELARHDRSLRGVVLARVGERQAVEDVMQEVALAAVRQRAPITDPTKVGAWLYRLAVTQSLMYRRTMGRRRKLTRRYAEQQESGHDRVGDPLDWLLGEERRARVRSAMAVLAPKDAEILLLKYTDHQTYQQLSEFLGVSTSAVESRLHRARARLRAELAALDVIELKTATSPVGTMP